MTTNTFTCPMHPEIRQDHPGRCPLCGMKLVLEGEEEKHEHESKKSSFFFSYKPLLVILGMLFLVVFVLGTKDDSLGIFTFPKAMSYFMAGFFLVFSGFKFLDLTGFAEGYSTYDLLAKRVFGYGYVYPFLELSLGLLYATGFMPEATNIATLILMTFSGLGVLESMRKKRVIQCACLGTIFKLPLTKVTLIEDFGMAFMALLMLVAI